MDGAGVKAYIPFPHLVIQFLRVLWAPPVHLFFLRLAVMPDTHKLHRVASPHPAVLEYHLHLRDDVLPFVLRAFLAQVEADKGTLGGYRALAPPAVVVLLVLSHIESVEAGQAGAGIARTETLRTDDRLHAAVYQDVHVRVLFVETVVVVEIEMGVLELHRPQVRRGTDTDIIIRDKALGHDGYPWIVSPQGGGKAEGKHQGKRQGESGTASCAPQGTKVVSNHLHTLHGW